MRIAHVIASLDPAMGGPPMVAARLAAAQAQLGHDVSIDCYRTAGSDASVAAALSTIPHVDRVSIRQQALTGRLERLTGRALTRPLARQIGDLDVLHLHGVWEAMLPAVARLARRHRVAYVVAPHGMLDPWSLRQRALKKRIALRLGYGRMLRGAAFLHVLNSDEARLIEPLRLGTPTRVIPNGVFLDEIDPLPAPGCFHLAHPELNNQPFVLFLGRLHYKKGLDYLADAFASLARQRPDVHLVVAGPDEGAGPDFKRRIGTAGLQDRVHLVGPLYGRAKYEALVDASCFCLPSRQEGFSIAITEALACRVPVVISDACHFPEVAEVNAGQVTALDAAVIAAALRRVLDDDALRKQMGDAGRRLIESRFTWPRIAELTITAYQNAS